MDQLKDRDIQTSIYWMLKVEDQLNKLDKRLTKLESRVNYLFALLGILVAVANFIAPIIVRLALG